MTTEPTRNTLPPPPPPGSDLEVMVAMLQRAEIQWHYANEFERTLQAFKDPARHHNPGTYTLFVADEVMIDFTMDGKLKQIAMYE